MFSCIYEYAMGISWFPMSNCVLRALKTSGEITNHFPSCHKHHHHHRHHVTIINNNNIIMSSSVLALRGGRRRQQTHASLTRPASLSPSPSLPPSCLPPPFSHFGRSVCGDGSMAERRARESFVSACRQLSHAHNLPASRQP